MRLAILCTAIAALVGGLSSSAPAQRSATVRTLLTTHRPISLFAQDGSGLAWVTRDDRAGRCRHLLHIRRAARAPADTFRIGCHLFGALALAGRTTLWKTLVGGGNTELDFEVRSVTAGARRPHVVEQLQESLDLDTGFPDPDLPLAGAGSTLAYYAEDIAAHEQSVRRVVRGAARTVFSFHRPLSLAVDGRRIAVVGQQLGGDGCGCNSSAVWSPDGRRIAFLDGQVNINSIEPAEVAVMNADGSGRADITHDRLYRLDTGATRSGLDWSPDGTEIAYSYFKGGGVGETIGVVHSDGTGDHDLGSGREPAWSPDGSTIAFSRTQGRGTGIFLMNADGSSVRQLAGGGEGPAWSPDGSRIAYTNGGALYVVNADGSGVRTLVSSGPYARNPDWSPDGSRIAFGGQAGYGINGGLWVVNADGTNLHQLTTESDDDPSWSPDGQRILFTSARDDITHTEDVQLELFTANADGSGLHPVTFKQPAEWVSAGEVRMLDGRKASSFAVAGAPALLGRAGTIAESRSIALGGDRLAVLSVLARTGGAQISLLDARTGALSHVVDVPSAPALELAGIHGRWVVYRTGVTVRALDATTLRERVLARLTATPIGLSVAGERVAWAENAGGRGGRIRALTLPR